LVLLVAFLSLTTKNVSARWINLWNEWSFDLPRTDHASTIAEMNALGVTAKGAVQLKDIAEKALTLTKIAPIGEAAHERIDYSTFNPATSQWRYGPNDARQREHLH
jgi:hypothetical protein